MPVDPELVVKTLMQQRSQLVGYAWAVVGDPHAAEDVLQDVSMLAIRKCSEINDVDHLGGWLRHAIRLRGMDVRRSLQKAQGQLFSPEVLDALERAWDKAPTVDESERMTALRHCIGQLTGSARRIVELRYVENLPPTEIATDTNQRVETVYKAITRTHGALRECIKQRLAAIRGRS
jgi:RNA polymerase sigma factor (sigma-70 family)